MTVLTCAITGKSITLVGEPIDSGEAKVWRTNLNGYLAKIYHSPTSECVQKLAVKISHPPTVQVVTLIIFLLLGLRQSSKILMVIVWVC